MGRMHADEHAIDTALVRRLVDGQFPAWADRPITALASGGTVNAVYRLGADLTVRLPLTAGGASDIAKERRALSALGELPVAVPPVVAVGEPAEGYPWPWAVHGWLDGSPALEGREAPARDLAEFVLALRANRADGPPAYRGQSLSTVDMATRRAIDELSRTDEVFDPAAALAVWAEALAAPQWTAPPSWVHADLMPSNLLLRDGRLSGVLDWATAGLGDPACDLIPAWNLLTAAGREIFRDAVGADDATWERGRGRALSMAVIQLPYYRHTNPVISANARYVLTELGCRPAP
ncbi:phosphotransferase [Amycolatopsis mediterranei S699]|uniref:Phosphotransferase n=2 Tax=Amycolatopsis mediterranei TaxID=33910 RepID=A0A9R0NYI4_AMYMS|nr:aminoglycoside phosphotransferase family protein [Amycolatopsis mediterranei]ADJ46187.1 putative phosphotransferase [Amycolatopsis mediterranei U32]AEK42978.1 phosphotransferase [Amycolatopsis mediterranei S699]AFO77898.1 phosphotransferase [Amycolatopsis mediterranei S699]AGT85026.1 phosphotransferase [Amycolatopsis mediterranei RB]KDO05723.1 phosphotransferase [Amycolatopsis mediterranei]